MVKKMSSYKIQKEFSICCSHRLNNDELSDVENQKLFGKCNNLPNHGHNYKIVLTLQSNELDTKTGMIMNFGDVKKVFEKQIHEIYDHKFLNECEGFINKITTAETMCEVFYYKLKKKLPKLYSVKIYETDTASAEFIEE